MTANTSTAPPSAALERASRLLRWILGLLILGYGLLTFDRDSIAWAALSLLLYALPLALQLTAWGTARIYGLWFGLFLVCQSLLGPLVKGDFVSLPANLHSTIDVRIQDAPGIRPGLRHISTDARGFRVMPAIDYANKRGARIVAIGGSTTEDIMLGDDSTWTHRLQQGLKARKHEVEVINTGVSGLRAANHLATLQVTASLKPDLVLVLVAGNDWNKQIRDRFEPNRDPYRPPELRRSPLGGLIARFLVMPLRARLTGQSSWDQHLVVDKPDGFNSDKPRRSLERATKHEFRPATVADGYRQDMQAISKACKDMQLRCLFITQPHAYSEAASEELRRLFWMTPPYASYTLDLGSMMHVAALYNRFLAELAQRDGHALCDVATGMEPSIRLFYDDMHYTDDGAARVAELVLPCVERQLAKLGR